MYAAEAAAPAGGRLLEAPHREAVVPPRGGDQALQPHQPRDERVGEVAARDGLERRLAELRLRLVDPAEADERLRAGHATPGNPRVLRGREEIAAWLDDICGRGMTHRVDRQVLASDRAAFVESCRYPDGTNVMCMAMLEVAGGRIVRQVAIHAWDQ